MNSPIKTTAAALNPLAERDSNAPVSPRKQADALKSKVASSLEESSKPAPGFLQRPKQSDAPVTYISPSDAIMSPASQKLSNMKCRRFASAKPKALFAKTVISQQHKSSTDSRLKEETLDTDEPGSSTGQEGD